MNSTLQTYQAETAVLQQKIHATLKQDGRIVAAWLFGSKGRSEGEASCPQLELEPAYQKLNVKPTE